VTRDWRLYIIRMIEVKQELFDADKERLWEYHWPRVAASEATLAHVENHLGFELDPEYREFLATGDGWPWFFHSACLFGSSELLGSPALLAANAMLDVAAPYIESQCGVQRSAVFPIASASMDKDIFFMQIQNGVLCPPIVWWAGEEIDRYVSFAEFFASMIEYNKRSLKALREE